MFSQRLFLNRIKHTVINVFRLQKYMIADALPYGLKFKFQTRSEVGRQIYYKYGVYGQDHICLYFLNTIGIAKGDLILDIGANIGWYSVVFASQAKAKVVAFEPNKENFAMLTDNIKMNGVENVHAFNVGVSDKNETVTLHLYKKHNPGGHSLIPHDKSYGTEQVEVVALDDFLEKKGFGEGPIRFLKMDIQGYEYTAIRNAEKTLSRTQYLIAEFMPDLLKKNGQDPWDMIRLLRKMGFRIQEINEQGFHEPDFEKIIPADIGIDLFCSKTVES